MKTTRTIPTIICLLAAAVLAACLTFERQAWLKLDQENNALRQQLTQMDELLADNLRLSNLVARANASPSRSNERTDAPVATDERAKELVRLRGEVEALREQSKEIETLRADTRQVRAAREAALQTRNATRPANSNNGTTASESSFEILKAEYWTDNTNLDVAAELRDRIRDDSLKAIASNNLMGDDTVVLTAAFEGRTDTQTGKLVMKKIGTAWKLSGMPR